MGRLRVGQGLKSSPPPPPPPGSLTYRLFGGWWSTAARWRIKCPSLFCEERPCLTPPSHTPPQICVTAASLCTITLTLWAQSPRFVCFAVGLALAEPALTSVWRSVLEKYLYDWVFQKEDMGWELEWKFQYGVEAFLEPKTFRLVRLFGREKAEYEAFVDYHNKLRAQGRRSKWQEMYCALEGALQPLFRAAVWGFALHMVNQKQLPLSKLEGFVRQGRELIRTCHQVWGVTVHPRCDWVGDLVPQP